MKKYTTIFGFIFCVLTLFIGCQDIDQLADSSDCTITAARAQYLTSATAGTFSTAVTGVIGDSTVTFTYTGTAATALDITNMRIYVTIPNSAKITPSLTGLKNMTNPLDIKVTAGDGTVKKYTISVIKN